MAPRVLRVLASAYDSTRISCVVNVSCSYSCGRDLSPDHAPQPIRAAMAQLASASSQQVHMPSVVAKQQKEEDRVEDLTHTADAYRRSALVARCFTAWVHFVAMARKTAKSQVWLCSVVQPLVPMAHSTWWGCLCCAGRNHMRPCISRTAATSLIAVCSWH